MNVNGLSFQPNLTWIKDLTTTNHHSVYDSVRGVQKRLEFSSNIDQAATDSGLTSFNSDGFSLGSLATVNTNTNAYVSLNFLESITSGLDIVYSAGTGAARTVSHNLGVVPEFMLSHVVGTEGGYWAVYHKSMNVAGGYALYIPAADGQTAGFSTYWNSTAPTASVFSVGSDTNTNYSSGYNVVYVFSPVSGYSKFDSYLGTNDVNGPYIFLGFKPAILIIKRLDSSGNWLVFNNKRLGYNPDNNYTFMNTTAADGTSDFIDIVSNGFKIRTTDTALNASGGTYIYCAWAEAPMKYSRAR